MTTLDPTRLTPTELAPMLHAWAAGLYPSEAAVGLLIAHGRWLRRRDFLATLVDAVDDGWGPRGSIVPMAAVDWDAARTFADNAIGSSSELSILRLATSLAGGTTSHTLMDMTCSLDEDNGRRVLDALAHRFGWHERGISHTVTGHQTGGRPRQELPTFEQMRAEAYKLLGDAADWLRSDWRTGAGPSAKAADAVSRAFTAIDAAKKALNAAANANTEARSGRHA